MLFGYPKQHWTIQDQGYSDHPRIVPGWAHNPPSVRVSQDPEILLPSQDSTTMNMWLTPHV